MQRIRCFRRCQKNFTLLKVLWRKDNAKFKKSPFHQCLNKMKISKEMPI